MPRQPAPTGPVYVVTANVLLTPAEFARLEAHLARTRKSRRAVLTEGLLAYLRLYEPPTGTGADAVADEPAAGASAGKAPLTLHI